MSVRSSPSEPIEIASADALGARVASMIDRLALLSDEEGRLTRLYLSSAHRKAADAIKSMMAEAGMDVREDAAGSVIGRYEGTDPVALTLLIGSHIDSVVDGGNYDGPLGVACGIAAVEALHRRGIRLPFAIEVIAFGDEENVRFPTSLSTSNALTGEYVPSWLDTRDGNGICLRDALRAFGGSPDGIAALARTPESLLGYIEVHIEQGPMLEVEETPVGVVTAINGIARAHGTISGEAGHAGTVPMSRRIDALTAFGEFAVAVSLIASRYPETVATIGKVKVEPGAPNVIPGRVEFTLDVRAPDDDVKNHAVGEIEQALRDIGQRCSVSVQLDRIWETAATPMDKELSETLERSIQREQLPIRRLPSGAGHDAVAMAKITPAAMLFVRCKGGISHSPKEFVAREDMATAAKVLLQAIAMLGRTPS